MLRGEEVLFPSKWEVKNKERKGGCGGQVGLTCSSSLVNREKKTTK